MRVLFLLDSLTPGGTETSTVALAGELLRRGHQPAIMSLRDVHPSLAEAANELGIRMFSASGTGIRSQVSSVRQALVDEPFDLLHTALFRSDQIGRIASWGLDVRVVSSFVNTPYERERLDDPAISTWKVRVLQALDAITGHLCVDHFHAVSEGAALSNQRALRLAPTRVTVCPRGRDPRRLAEPPPERVTAIRTELGITHDTAIALNIGRLDRQKAQTIAIEATKILSDAGVDIVLLIAGKDGSAAGEVKDAINSLTDRDVVRLLGHRNDIDALLGAADVVVISSDFEGTAGAALEAMAAGVPVVSTDVVGLRGILVDESTALLVRRRCAPELARAIQRLLDDIDLAEHLASAGREEFAARFTLDAAGTRMIDLYRRALRR